MSCSLEKQGGEILLSYTFGKYSLITKGVDKCSACLCLEACYTRLLSDTNISMRDMYQRLVLNEEPTHVTNTSLVNE